MELLGVLAMSLALGLRHGVDVDHIAALLDITGGSAGTKMERFKLSFWYAVGHEAVVCLLGMAIMLFAWSLPIWVDHLMGKAVGLTLIVMGLWMLLGRKRPHEGLLSRGVALVRAMGKKDAPFTFTRKNVLAVGIIHGIGAETPSQLLLFTAIAGMAAKNHGILVVLAFGLGLLITHICLAMAGIWIHDLVRKTRPITVYAASIVSLVLGIGYCFGL